MELPPSEPSRGRPSSQDAQVPRERAQSRAIASRKQHNIRAQLGASRQDDLVRGKMLDLANDLDATGADEGAAPVIRRELKWFGGTEMDSAGDSFFATFRDPVRAVQCARMLARVLADLGLSSRFGVHCSVCEMRGEEVSGLAVWAAARDVDGRPRRNRRIGHAAHSLAQCRPMPSGPRGAQPERRSGRVAPAG